MKKSGRLLSLVIFLAATFVLTVPDVMASAICDICSKECFNQESLGLHRADVHRGGGTSPSQSPAQQQVETIKQVGSLVESIISLFGSSGGSSYGPPVAPTYGGVHTKNNYSGPSASQRAATAEWNKMGKDPDWSSGEVARKLKQPDNAAAKINDEYEALRKATCDIAYGFDPFDKDGRGGSINPDGTVNNNIDELAALGITEGETSASNDIKEWCKPLPSWTSADFAAAKTPGQPPPLPNRPGTRPGTRLGTRLGFVMGAIDAKKYNVAAKEREVVQLGKKLKKAEDASDMWNKTLKDAEKKPPPAAPQEKKKRKSMLEDIRREKKKADETIVQTEQKKQEAAQELQKARKELVQTRARAKVALRDGKKFDEFFDENKAVVADEQPQAQAPAEKPDEQAKTPADREAAAEGEKEHAPDIHIWRPSADAIYFTAEAFKKYGEDSIPWPGAKVAIVWPGFYQEFNADMLGKVSINPLFVDYKWPKKVDRIEIQAACEGAVHKLLITRQELDHYIKTGAENLVAQGDVEFKATHYPEAAQKYWTSIDWLPTDRASKGWLACLEKEGAGYATLQAYQAALMRHIKDAGARRLFKQKAIDLAKSLKPQPPAPDAAARQLQQGQEAFDGKDETRALIHYEVASALAPWWHEPYYGQAMLYEYLMAHRNFYFCRPAIQSFELFLLAAPKGDKRIQEARANLERLTAMEAKMRQ